MKYTKEITFIILIILLCTSCFGATYYIDNTATGAGDGSSWTDAYTTFSAAFAARSGVNTYYVSGGTSGKTYSESGTAVINIGSNDDGSTITSSTDTGHNGIVTINGVANANHCVNSTINSPDVVINGLYLIAGSTKYCVLNYAPGMIVTGCTLDGVSSSQRLLLTSGNTATTTLTKCIFINSTSPNYSIYGSSGGDNTLNYCKIIGGATTTNNYVYSGGGGAFTSNNCLYTNLPAGAFYADTSSSTIVSNNDMFIGLHRLYPSSSSNTFMAAGTGSVTINNSYYDGAGGRTPRADYIDGGTVTINNSHGYKYSKITHHRRHGLVTVLVDSSDETYVKNCASVGNTYGIPLSFGLNRYSVRDSPTTQWADNETEVKAELYALTQSPNEAHEITNHTISHPYLSLTSAFTATYSGAGAGQIIISGTYPDKIATITSNGVTVAELDITDDDYGAYHRDLTTVGGLRLAINDLTNWATSAASGGPTGSLSRGLKNGTYTITTDTAVPQDIDTNYDFWKSEITGMTDWIESFMGANYVKAFIIPYGTRDGTTYTATWQTWMNNNIATTHCGGARTMHATEETSPTSSLLADGVAHIMGIGTQASVQLVVPDSENATETSIRENTRAWASWVAETGALGVLTVHETECSVTQLGYILDEITKAQDISIYTFGGLIDYIRTSGLWVDAGSGAWTRTYTDLSDYHLLSASPCIDSGSNLGSSYQLDYNGSNQNSYGSGWDIGAYVDTKNYSEK
jgi:hypothetical protein